MLEVGIAITTAQDVFTNCENTLKSPGDQPKVAAAVVRLLWPNFTAVGLHCYTSTKIFLPRPNSHMAPVPSTNLENPLIFDQEDKLLQVLRSRIFDEDKLQAEARFDVEKMLWLAPL